MVASCGLNVKYPPQAVSVCFNGWHPADGTVLEGCGLFMRWNLPRGSASLEDRLEVV